MSSFQGDSGQLLKTQQHTAQFDQSQIRSTEQAGRTIGAGFSSVPQQFLEARMRMAGLYLKQKQFELSSINYERLMDLQAKKNMVEAQSLELDKLKQQSMAEGQRNKQFQSMVGNVVEEGGQFRYFSQTGMSNGKPNYDLSEERFGTRDEARSAADKAGYGGLRAAELEQRKLEFGAESRMSPKEARKQYNDLLKTLKPPSSGIGVDEEYRGKVEEQLRYLKGIAEGRESKPQKGLAETMSGVLKTFKGVQAKLKASGLDWKDLSPEQKQQLMKAIQNEKK